MSKPFVILGCALWLTPQLGAQAIYVNNTQNVDLMGTHVPAPGHPSVMMIGGGTVGEGLTPKTAAIHPFTRQSNEQGAMTRTAGIARERFKLWIREVFCHRQTHRMKKRMECLGHQPNTSSGAVLIRSKRAGAGPL